MLSTKTVIVNEKVRYDECDSMGIVHHSKYLIWMEIGRMEIAKHIGINLIELQHKNILLPVAELQCKYIRSAKFGDEVKVLTELEYPDVPKLVFNNKVYRNNELLMSARTVIVIKDLKKGVLLKFPSELRNKLDKFFEN